MNDDEIIEIIKDILEEEVVSATDELENFIMWDSLAQLSLISACDDVGLDGLSDDALSDCKTVNDIISLIRSLK